VTLQEIRAWVRQQLREDYNLAFSDLVINNQINNAYRELARIGMFLWKSANVTVDTSGVVTLPVNLIAPPLIVRYNNVPLSRENFRTLDIYLPNWRTLTGSSPSYWVFQPPQAILIVPKPSAGTWTLEVDGFWTPMAGDATFPLLSADTDVPKIPEAFHLALGYKAIVELAQMAPEDQLLQSRAAYYASLYANILQEIMGRYRQPIDVRGMDLPVVSPPTQERR
jgi:hypothetical protein